jgi:hypothetical protein
MCIDRTERAGNFRESETTSRLNPEYELDRAFPISKARGGAARMGVKQLGKLRKTVGKWGPLE